MAHFPTREEHLANLRASMIARHIDPRSPSGRLMMVWASEAYHAGVQATEQTMVTDLAEMSERLVHALRRLRDAQERIELITERATLYPRPPVPLLRLVDQCVS